MFCRKHGFEITGCSRFSDCENCPPVRVPYDEWAGRLIELREENSITIGEKIDEKACRRIAILVSELFVTMFPHQDKDVAMIFMILERAIYDFAREHKLTCDPLDKRRPSEIPATGTCL